MHGWDETNTRTSWAMSCVQEMSVATESEQGLRRLTTTRTFTCSPSVARHFPVSCASCWCFSGSWFSRCHWCRTPHLSAGSFFFSSTAFHHACAIPSANFFPFGCCSPTVSCHRQLSLYSKFLHISHRENGFFEVLSVHLRRSDDSRVCLFWVAFNRYYQCRDSQCVLTQRDDQQNLWVAL